MYAAITYRDGAYTLISIYSKANLLKEQLWHYEDP